MIRPANQKPAHHLSALRLGRTGETMAEKRSNDSGGEEVDFKAVKHRFMQLNNAHLQRARMALRDKQREVLDLLPLLFHVNHPMLPGYASRAVPVGVWGYEPDRKTLNLARSLAKSFSYRKVPHKVSPITAIYFMGSTGTIAHAGDSDFDFWLCHDPALGKEDVERLNRKARQIKKWALTLDLEIHFFLINATEFREGKLRALSSESSGSAQHNLLLDEFYRTSVLLVGQFPLWWLVPPEYEAAYDLYVSELQRKRFIYARDCIDFGGLVEVPAEEFFGAALWQISKGIDSPYKSILKLLLIEAYASEYPGMELLSKQFKQKVYDGDVDPERLDPYMLMLNKVSDYLGQNSERTRLELARRCFYFKADIRLTDAVATPRPDWRRSLLGELTQDWQWTRADLMLMDARNTWKVHRVIEERQVLFEALITSYRFLSDFARKYAGLSMISQRDLTTLGRKLYTAFERKAGKIDIVNHGILADLYEPQLTLGEVVNEEGDGSGWHAYRGAVNLSDLRMETPIKRARSLIELIAWCYFNKVISKRTVFVLYSSRNHHTASDVENLVNNLAARFPLELLESSQMKDYATAAALQVSEIFINTGVRIGDSMALTKNLAATGHTDPFCYGHQQQSLVLAMDHLHLTSWHEVLVHRYGGNNNVMESLCEYLKWYPPSAGAVPPVPHVYAIGAVLGNAVARRVEGLFREIIDLFYRTEEAVPPWFVVTIGRSHYVFTFAEGLPRYEELNGFVALTAYLGQPRGNFTTVLFDERSLKESFLPLIFANNKPGVVQFFYFANGAMADVFILDEKGSLFYQQGSFYDCDTMLGQYSRFFDAVSNRINFMLQEGAAGSRIEGLEFYELTADAIGRKKALKVSPQLYPSGKKFFSLQVIVEQNETGESVFTLYCDSKEFSTLEYGKNLFRAVIDHVLLLRQSGQSYPIYITDISLERSVVGEENMGKLQTVNFLNYKRRIEEQLNR